MMDPARGEFNAVGMTHAPIAITHTKEESSTKALRTPLESRKKAAAAVQLHREEKGDVGAVAETVGACKRACRGMAYDLKHWDELPADGAMQRAQIVATRGGRLPYLVLTVSVAFLVFFLVMHAVKWVARNSQGKKGMIMYENTGGAHTSRALPAKPPPPSGSVVPATKPPRVVPAAPPVVGPPDMVPQSLA